MKRRDKVKSTLGGGAPESDKEEASNRGQRF
jgi:hypothetical protein